MYYLSICLILCNARVNIAEQLDAAVKGTVYYQEQMPFKEYKKSTSCTIEIVSQ